MDTDNRVVIAGRGVVELEEDIRGISSNRKNTIKNHITQPTSGTLICCKAHMFLRMWFFILWVRLFFFLHQVKRAPEIVSTLI